jgi:hypothetical protein
MNCLHWLMQIQKDDLPRDCRKQTSPTVPAGITFLSRRDKSRERLIRA